ncbi:MAG: hypothetical protein IKH86_10005 [Prevotella sp.]|nr:hypothetical protein [Prevotella sp.]
MKKYMYWLLAVVVTLALSIYQRMTGPTYPKKVTVELNGESYKLKLPRSGVQKDEIVKLKGIPPTTSAQLHYRQYQTPESSTTPAPNQQPLSVSSGTAAALPQQSAPNGYTTINFTCKDSMLQAALPVQPVAGKLQYYITVGGKDYPADGPTVIRFRNDVPAMILVPHILLMFAAMLFAVYTLMLVVTRKEYGRWLKITVATLFVGGFVFGPLVQHAAFGPWWTGFPYGTDLTDNKTLLSFLVFVAALATLKWKYNRWVVAASVLFMILIFSIPHSAYGSEYDYETQQLKQ